MHAWLSIFSLVLALFFINEPMDFRYEVGVDLSPCAVTVTFDPTFIFWADDSRVPSCSAFTFGNVVVMRDTYRGTAFGEEVLQHELNHVVQCRALGWWMWPASLMLPIDPVPVQGDTPEERNSRMWLPSDGWPEQWHFMSIRIGFG